MTTRHFSAFLLTCLFLVQPGFAAALYFPDDNGGWQHIDPATAGWDATLLSAALDVAGQRNSSGVVVLLNGRILAERYWDGPDSEVYKRFLQGEDAEGHAIEDVASAQKSVVAVLTGMAQERGYLDIDDAVSDYLGVGWSQASAAQEQVITIRHLLSMTSGLDTDFEFVGEAGSRWLYNTPVYHSTMRVLMAATGLDRNELTVGWISQPLGMSNTSWTARPWAEAAIAVGLSTTARDLARFGLMIQADGHWGDEEIVADREFLTAMLTPSQALNPAYGYLWWLNGQDFILGTGPGARRSEGTMIDAAPQDLVAMQGAGDRKLYLVPSMGLVISRLGYTGGRAGDSFNDAFWEALMRAAP